MTNRGTMITKDKSMVDTELLLQAQPHLPTATRDFENSEVFVALNHSQPIALCMVQKKKNHSFDLVGLGALEHVQGMESLKELVYYVMDYARLHGCKRLEIGVGNAEFQKLELLQKMGFRIVGVWRDYYFKDNMQGAILNGIENADMLRLSFDLKPII